jgi:hypothetical protein
MTAFDVPVVFLEVLLYRQMSKAAELIPRTPYPVPVPVIPLQLDEVMASFKYVLNGNVDVGAKVRFRILTYSDPKKLC